MLDNGIIYFIRPQNSISENFSNLGEKISATNVFPEAELEKYTGSRKVWSDDMNKVNIILQGHCQIDLWTEKYQPELYQHLNNQITAMDTY